MLDALDLPVTVAPLSLPLTRPKAPLRPLSIPDVPASATLREIIKHRSFVVVRISHALVVFAVLLVLGQTLARHLRGADLHLLAVSSAVGEGRSARGTRAAAISAKTAILIICVAFLPLGRGGEPPAPPQQGSYRWFMVKRERYAEAHVQADLLRGA